MEIRKISRRRTRSLGNAELGHFTLLFCRGQPRNVQRCRRCRGLFELPIDDYVNHTCGNGGSCIDGVNSYSCNCLLEFTGGYCELGRMRVLSVVNLRQ